jgi:hypothetical protein
VVSRVNRVNTDVNRVLTYVVRAAVVFHTTSLEEMPCGNSGSVDLRNQTRDARAEWAREMRQSRLNETFP